eukprot:7461653-Pyramimonas_sp.AAC.1
MERRISRRGPGEENTWQNQTGPSGVWTLTGGSEGGPKGPGREGVLLKRGYCMNLIESSSDSAMPKQIVRKAKARA